MLAKDEANRARLAAVMYNLCEAIRIISILVSPFLPHTAPKIQAQLGAPAAVLSWEQAGEVGPLAGLAFSGARTGRDHLPTH